MQKLFKDQSSGVMPEVFAPQNDIERTTQYRFNIVKGKDADDKDQYTYDCLIVPFPCTRKNIFSHLIEALYPTSLEQKMQNDFIAKRENIDPDADDQPFINFLAARKAIRQQLINDCFENHIPEE